MKKILVSIVALSLLTGCAKLHDEFETVGTAVVQTVTPDNFDTVTEAFGTVEAIAVGYRRLCQRKVINKSCWQVVSNLQPYEQKAYDAYIVLKDFVKNNPTVNAVTFIRELRIAVDNFKSAQARYGVK